MNAKMNDWLATVENSGDASNTSINTEGFDPACFADREDMNTSQTSTEGQGQGQGQGQVGSGNHMLDAAVDLWSK